MIRTLVKAEPISGGRGSSRKRMKGGAEDNGVEPNTANEAESGTESLKAERRVLRSRYHAVKTLICDEREEISRVNSDKFNSIINEVESLHQLVQKPREQVADAEALLDITNTLVAFVKAQSKEGITPSDFVHCLLRDFGQKSRASSSTEEGRDIAWKDIGLAVSHVIRRVPGCCTMLGPMNTEPKQRKVVVYKKRARQTERTRQPEQLNDAATEEKTDTDRNMATMFDILRKNRRVRLENLVINRNSFAQTVENVFALSFLVKDGRAEISVDEKGWHIISPRNAPAASAVVSGEVSYSHFVFRFDFRDWKLMMDSVGVGEEVMPHRNQHNVKSDFQADRIPGETRATVPRTPIRKFSRSRGLVVQEGSIVKDSPGSDDSDGKRTL